MSPDVVRWSAEDLTVPGARRHVATGQVSPCRTSNTPVSDARVDAIRVDVTTALWPEE